MLCQQIHKLQSLLERKYYGKLLKRCLLNLFRYIHQNIYKSLHNLIIFPLKEDDRFLG